MRLFWKLFLLQLLAATAVLAGVLAFSRAHSIQGFAEFLEQRERERVEQLAERLGEAYERNFDLGAAWDELPAVRRERRERREPPPEVEVHERRDGHHERVIVRKIVRPPLQLQDADGAYLRGDRNLPPEDLLREPIESDDRVVGFIAWPKAPRHPEQAAFAHEQLMHMVRVLPVAMLVAAAFALLTTLLIVRPIRQLSGGTAALARREFAVRLPEQRRDELGALARDFNRLAEALQGYDARQRQWVADISHELRTPVAVLRGELEALIDGVRAPDANAVRSLREEVRRLEALIQDLHLVSVAESGGLRLNLAPADVGALVRQAAERFRERLKARGFDLQLDVGAASAATVDAQRLDQVLANLLENALHHATPPGPITVTARGAADSIVLTVADAGPGVPPDALPRLFDRLYRVESSRTRGNGGAGLGLAICKSIVEAHGGSIEARGSAAGGLEIVVKLPAHG